MALFFRKLFHQLPPYLLTKFLKGIGLFGTSFFYLVTLVFLSLVHLHTSIRALVAFASIEIISAIIKILYPKHRPVAGKRETLLDKYEAGSFPSIHAARISAMSVLMWSLLPQDWLTLLCLIFLVISVAYSRVHRKRHFYTDVIAGVILGFFIMRLALGLNLID